MNQLITQAQETYTWVALDADGGFIAEYDHPEGRGFADVDGMKVKHLKLDPNNPFLQSHCVEIPDGAIPVFFRRRSIALQPSGGETLPSVHCIGWKKGDTSVYLFVFNDGSTLLTDDLQAV